MRLLVVGCLLAAGLVGGSGEVRAQSFPCGSTFGCTDAAGLASLRAAIDAACNCATSTAKEYKKCANRTAKDSSVSKQCKKAAKMTAKFSNCGRSDKVPCNKRNRGDTKTTCKIVSASKCADKGGSPCGAFLSCADACNPNAEACATTTSTSTTTTTVQEVSTTTTTLPCICADNVLNDGPGCGEACDDGNTTDGDGCQSNCTRLGCGNGIVEAGETCDPPGSGTGQCAGGEICDDTCNCVAKVACTCGTGEPTHLRFTTKVPTGSCGTIVDGDGAPIMIGGLSGLACGGLYFGGGDSVSTLPAFVPDEGTSIVKATCSGDTLILSDTTAAELGGTSPVLRCTHAGCFFGSPLPIPNVLNPAISTCIVNIVSKNAVGRATCSTGAVDPLDLPLTAKVHLTGDIDDEPSNGIQACPICNNGTCQFGPNDGLPCTPGSTAGLGNGFPTSHDCPPPGGAALIGTLSIAFRLRTPTTTVTATNLGVEPGRTRVFFGYCRDVDDSDFFGICTGGTSPGATCAHDPDCGDGGTCGGAIPCTSDAQCSQPLEACSQKNDGAFGSVSANTISETGTPAGNLGPRTVLPSTLVSLFGIPPTFAPSIDGVAGLPGPGAVALQGETQLLP